MINSCMIMGEREKLPFSDIESWVLGVYDLSVSQFNNSVRDRSQVLVVCDNHNGLVQFFS